MNISVVIITKNEAHIIGTTLQSIRQLTDDIVIVDSGSADDTIAICKTFNARVIETGWAGYGMNKNKGIDAARYEWILNLDADEAVDTTLLDQLLRLPLQNDQEVFEMRFKNFFCGKEVRFGEWGFDRHIRLFNRKQVRWNDAAVHENLLLPADAKKILLPGHILHYTVHSLREYRDKTDYYARMNAKKYHAAGKRAGVIKRYLSPVFAFLQHYVVRLGFLDGAVGFIIAKTTARYTFLKYRYLKEMNSDLKQ